MVLSLEIMSSYRVVIVSVFIFYPFFGPVFILKVDFCFTLVSISQTLLEGSQQGSPDKIIRKERNVLGDKCR